MTRQQRPIGQIPPPPKAPEVVPVERPKARIKVQSWSDAGYLIAKLPGLVEAGYDIDIEVMK